MVGVFDGIEVFGDRVAAIEAAREVSYAELSKAADCVGAGVAAARVGRRALAVVVCRNDIDCLTGYVGLMRSGAVLLLLHHSANAGQVAALAAEFGATHIYAPHTFAARGELVLDQGGYCLRRLANGVAPDMAEDLALLLGTSGSTGNRSLVRLSHRNLRSNAHSIADYLAIKHDDRAITTMPMSYSYGLSIIHSHLLSGASVILTEDSLMTQPFWHAVKENRVTNFGGVPFIYEMLKRLRFERMDLPDLRLLTQAGGRLSRDLVLDFAGMCAAKGMEFVVMYGQTEATARISYLPFRHAQAKPVSIGMAIPGGTLALVDEAGAEIHETGMAGELVYSGDNVSMGYARCAADLARGDDNGGILHTGDIASRDVDGFYTIIGRKARFLKVFGHRVNLDELERIIRDAGHECACGGEDDHVRIYVQPGVEPRLVQALVASETTLNAHGFSVVTVDVLPRFESGKVNYAALRGEGA